MTNKARQANLDKQKWLASEDMGFDRSGAEIYCDYCDKQTMNASNWTCTATQAERESECLCAKAYNRKYSRKSRK